AAAVAGRHAGPRRAGARRGAHDRVAGHGHRRRWRAPADLCPAGDRGLGRGDRRSALTLALDHLGLAAHLDPARLLLGLRHATHPDLEQAAVVVGLDVVRGHVLGKGELAAEAARAALPDQPAALLLAGLLAALAA